MTPKQIAERVVWTFVQAFVGAVPVTFALTANSLKTVGASAASAGIAAVISLAKNLTVGGTVKA